MTLFNQIHEIIFHGNGGFDYNTVYNMPIWLRNFTFNKIKSFYTPTDNQEDMINKSVNSMKQAMMNGVVPPPNSTSYVTKAPLKK